MHVEVSSLLENLKKILILVRLSVINLNELSYPTAHPAMTLVEVNLKPLAPLGHPYSTPWCTLNSVFKHILLQARSECFWLFCHRFFCTCGHLILEHHGRHSGNREFCQREIVSKTCTFQ